MRSLRPAPFSQRHDHERLTRHVDDAEDDVQLLRPRGFETFGPSGAASFFPSARTPGGRIAEDPRRQLLHVEPGNVDLNHGEYVRVHKRRDRFDPGSAAGAAWTWPSATSTNAANAVDMNSSLEAELLVSVPTRPSRATLAGQFQLVVDPVLRNVDSAGRIRGREGRSIPLSPVLERLPRRAVERHRRFGDFLEAGRSLP